MGHQRRGFTVGSSNGLFANSRGGSAGRKVLEDTSGMPDLTNINASKLADTGSSHAGQKLGDGSYDPLAGALKRKGLQLVNSIPSSRFNSPDEEEQYYKDAIRRFEDAAKLGTAQAQEQAVGIGLTHSGALMGTYGDIGERLQLQKNEAARGLAVDERTFRETALTNRVNAASGIQGQLEGQKITRAGLMGTMDGKSTEARRQANIALYGYDPDEAVGAAWQPAPAGAGTVVGGPGQVGGPGGTKEPPTYTPAGADATRAGLATPAGPRVLFRSARQAADIAQQKIGNVITSAAAQGKAAVLNPDGTLQTNADGSVKLVDSLEAKKLNLQTTETMGGYVDPDTKRWVPTLQGKATTQDIASKQAADQRAWIEMYGGGAAPMTFTADEFQNAPIDAKQGDANYDAKWDLDGDGVITVGDVIDIAGEAKDNGDGTFSYTNTKAAATGPRTLEGQKLDVQSRELAGRLGLDLQKFKEAQDQFTRTLKLDRQKFMTDASGYVYDENLQPVGMKNPYGTTRPMTTLERDKFTEMRDEFNANFDEAQYKFVITAGLDQRQIDATERLAIQAANMQMWLGLGEIGADVLSSEAGKKLLNAGADFLIGKIGSGESGGGTGNTAVDLTKLNPKKGTKPAVGGQAKTADAVDLVNSISLGAKI